MDTDVQEDDRSKVQVCVRVKPLTAKEVRSGAKRCAVAHDNCVILGAKDPKIFTFDAVADEASEQEEIFAMVGKSITDSCIAGYNGSIFAYGQTGSGKTHTIQGAMTPSGEFLPGMKGLIPRVLDHMYFLMDQSEKASLGSVRFECRCSFLEIYKEKIMDLLNPTMLDLSIREDIKRGIYVENLTEQPVSSTAEALEVLRVGAANRHVAATGCNEFSSRSHSVFTITIKSKARQGLEEKNGVVQTRYSRLNLIDLAGSERQKLSQTKGEQLKEAGHINKSLALLGNVIRALVEIAGGKHRHVPYRDSKLTFLLKDSLGGNSKTTIIATISPLDTAFAETLSTLKFAQRAKLIQNKAVVNQDLDGGSNYAQYAQLQRELKRVREQLAMEKARNQLADPSMAVVPQNGALRARRNDVAAQALPTNQTQNEHVRRLEALLNQLKSYETIEDERRRLREGNAHLKEQCASKDKFVQSARALIKLRDATIESLQKKTPRTGRLENEALRQEIQQLKAMVENHPELLKHARESHNRKTKLQEYKRLFGDNMKVYWEEIGKAQYLAKELSTYLERVKSGSKGGHATYEALLASPVASTTEKKRVGWADTTTTTTDAQPMNWSLISKRQKIVESDAAQPSEVAAPVAVARKARDARKSIAWFNHEYEEEHSWDLETSTTTFDGGNHQADEAAEGTTAGITKEQAAALEKALHGLEDKLREEQIMRNQIELLLEEEKARSSLELTKWQSEFALAQQQIDALVHEKNSLSSDLTVKNERLRSLNHNFLMTKGSTAASSGSSLSGSVGSSKSRSSGSSDSSEEEEFGDWGDVHKGFDNDDGYEPVSLRRLTMGVGLLRRANAAAQDKQQMKLAKKQKKRMGSFGGDSGDLLYVDEDDNNVAAKAARKSRKQNIHEVRMLDLERRLAEKENEIERLQDKFNNMKEEYEVLIEEKRFREEEDASATTTATTEGSATTPQLHAEQFVHEVEEMERRMKERNLEYEREVMQLREDIDDRQREWEAERQERDERERRLVASLDAAEDERALRETELEGLRREVDEVREEMRREISGYVSKMGDMGRLFGEKRRELEEEHLNQLQRALGERDEARAQAALHAEAGERVVASRDEEIERLTQELEAAKSQANRRLAQLANEQAADYERRIDSLNREIEAMQRLSDGELAKLRLELDRRALEFETEKERRDHRERELDEAKSEALDQQRRYYEQEMTRIKEEMARQWAEWENRGREDERETKGMILRLNEEKEELIARARKDRDDAQLEHQRAAALLEDRLRQTADAAQATEARLRGELSRIEEELAAVAEAKATLELQADEQHRAFELQIAGLESSIAATGHELTAELGALRDELDAAQRANRDLQSAHDAEREQLARDSEIAMATLRAAHDAELAQQAASSVSEAATLRMAHDAALEQLTALLSAKASEVEALERLVQEKESEIESAKHDARRERDELEARHLGQVAELAAALEAKEKEMAALKDVEASARREVEERAAAEVTRLEQAKKAELTELEEKHGREIEELTTQEKRMMHDFAVMKEEIEKSINERIDYIKQIETRRQAERQAQDEIARLNDTMTRMQKDFKSLMQEKHQLEARVEELVLINGKLTGHQNLNQKIQHHVKVKQENNSLKIQLQKLKKELDRTKSELAKFRPEGSVDLAADEDEEEKLKKQLAQQEEVIGALDTQLKALRGQLSSLYNAHIGSTTAATGLTGGDALSSADGTTEAEDASFSFEVVLDQLGLKLKGMSQEISDLHFKKLLLERENALYAKKSQHGLGFSSSSSSSATTTASTAGVSSSAPTSSSSSSSSSLPASSTPSASTSSHALADVTNFEFNASPAASSPTIALKEATTTVTTKAITTKPATAATSSVVHNADKENAVAAAAVKEKPSRSGSRREPRGEAKERSATATDGGKRRPREEREAAASGSSGGSGTGGGKERRVRLAVLQRTLSSASNRP